MLTMPLCSRPRRQLPGEAAFGNNAVQGNRMISELPLGIALGCSRQFSANSACGCCTNRQAHALQLRVYRTSECFSKCSCLAV